MFYLNRDFPQPINNFEIANRIFVVLGNKPYSAVYILIRLRISFGLYQSTYSLLIKKYDYSIVRIVREIEYNFLRFISCALTIMFNIALYRSFK